MAKPFIQLALYEIFRFLFIILRKAIQIIRPPFRLTDNPQIEKF